LPDSTIPAGPENESRSVIISKTQDLSGYAGQAIILLKQALL
jgi:hypothetical protein